MHALYSLTRVVDYGFNRDMKSRVTARGSKRKNPKCVAFFTGRAQGCPGQSERWCYLVVVREPRYATTAGVR